MMKLCVWLVILLFWGVFRKHGSAEASVDDIYQHSIVVDSGSTGSRVYLYRYREKDPFSSLEAICRIRMRPALSTFTNNTAGLSAQLDKFVEFAHSHIPLDDWKRTSFTLRATAGVRKLDEVESNSLMTRVKSLLESKLAGASDFNFDHTHSGVIAGEMEALYDISAVMVSVRNSSEASVKTYGSLDMGGSSMQYAYSQSSVGNYLSSLRPYLRSFSGMGLIDSMEESLLNFYSEEGSTSGEGHPCLPSGGIPREDREGFEEVDVIPGTGNFEACVTLLRQTLLQRMLEEAGFCHNSEDEDGVEIEVEMVAAAKPETQGARAFVPDVVVGLDNVPSLLFMLGLHSRSYGETIERVEDVPLVSPAEIAAAGERVCTLSWREVLLQADPTSSFQLPSYRGHRACFGAALLLVTLEEVVLRGCGLSEPDSLSNLSTEGILLPVDEVNGVGELSWALGAALMDALEEVPRKDVN